MWLQQWTVVDHMASWFVSTYNGQRFYRTESVEPQNVLFLESILSLRIEYFNDGSLKKKEAILNI